ncbi:hypothetical protein Q4574_09745 [Aliiglaciecola sp. 3_MG-2023]|uniref:hypothetical protein n=1 Tax=Aliiglaciecola sp. 3_MG-2023 TaxID=3062644 RepID=UPI0026E2BE79|nr:hypothetical protein [Aliiglaciecola sp. 3_MG-2023]MDO6693567.1 hypothetical protein [Aliiglaciecola sp. 3_MG-2023]
MNNQIKSRDRELSDGLLRQRRNLIMSSIGILIFVVLGFELETVRFLGNTVKLTSHENVYVVLLCIHIYFCFRFGQYYLEENHRPSFLSVIRSNNQNLEKLYFESLALKSLDQFFRNKKNQVFVLLPRLATEDNELYKLKSEGDPNFFFAQTPVYVSLGDELYRSIFEYSPENKLIVKNKVDFRGWEVLEKLENINSFKTPFLHKNLEYSRLKIILIRIKSFIKYLVIQSNFSDYEFPIVLALIPFLLSMY